MQRNYIREMQKKDIVFGIGPAGTGKTFLAMAYAINRFLQKSCSRIILTRPVVEAGENLGFLPGDLHEKLSPFLRPLFDALNDILDIDRVGRLMEKGEIEIAPLAYMRGRTLNNAFVILDEAQNTTAEQMKMFLTRIGNGTTAVVTGDITQTDLPTHKKSGLIDASDVLNSISDIGFVKFSSEDVVRTKIVQKIVTAYEKYKK
jgi:phosphate starvation-inducible PhoH-like protein